MMEHCFELDKEPMADAEGALDSQNVNELNMSKGFYKLISLNAETGTKVEPWTNAVTFFACKSLSPIAPEGFLNPMKLDTVT